MLAARRMMNRRAVPAPTPVAIPSTSNAGRGTTGLSFSLSCASAFTPEPNALVMILVTAFMGTFGPPTITVSDTLGGLTWSEVTTGWFTDANHNRYKTSIFYAFAPSSPTSGNVTVTASAVASGRTTMTLTACQSTGVDTTTPIAQSASALLQATAGDGTTTHSLTDTLPSSPAGTVFAVLGQHYVNGGGTQPGADPDFTHLVYFQSTFTTVELDLDVQYATTGPRQSITWTGLREGSGGFAWWFHGLMVELTPN